MVFVEMQKDPKTMKRVVEIPNDIKSVTTVPEWQLNLRWEEPHGYEEMIKALRS